MNKKSTKRALLTSIVSLMICCTMLIGTTFAWFTDTVTSANNKIQAGNLDVELYMWNNATDSEKISERTEPIFGTAALATNSTKTIWEPGKTQTVYFSLKNEGSLDLKYKVDILVKNPANSKNLYEVMEYAITPDAKYGEVDTWTTGKNVVLGVNETEAKDVALKTGEEHFFALSVHMDEEAGNEYMNGEVSFDINVLAGQLSSESDSFGEDYDLHAAYPGTGYAPAPEDGTSAVEIPIRNEEDAKVGSVVIPAGAVAAGTNGLQADIKKTEYAGNFTVAAGMETQSFDISVEGLKDDNTEPVKVEVRMPARKDPSTFKLYHYDTEIPCTYDPVTGYVTFETATFSPFTIVYDEDSVYVPPVVEESKLPKATVAASPEYVNTELPWESYGQWSPTEGLDANLEAAYTFTCEETLEEAKENPYANWYCDFYVKLDKDLGENQIFLGGNYGSFGWVGFHNGDLTLEANTEIGLLESVTTNPWTYLDVVQNVGKFICGVGDVDNALSGATFTVMLRLTNPEDATDFVNVETINYTFN